MEQQMTMTRTGTIGGTLLVLLIQINFRELVETAILAFIGATVSFFVTLGLKWMKERWKQRKRS